MNRRKNPTLDWFLSNHSNPDWDFSICGHESEPFALSLYSASLKVAGVHTKGVGHGAHQRKDQALSCAIGEAIERLAVTAAGLGNSNGVATDLSKRAALTRARLELIERHLLMAHFWGDQQFFKPSGEIVKLPYLQRVADLLRAQHHTLHLFEMQKIANLASHVAIILSQKQKKPTGLLFGSSTKKTAAQSAIASVNEALCQYLAMTGKKNMGPLSLRQFCRLKNPTFIDHARLGWHAKYRESLGLKFLSPLPNRLNRPLKLSPKDIKIERLKLPNDIKIPFHIFRATSTTLLPFQAGHLTASQRREIARRLTEFWKPRRQMQKMRELPHPFP